METLVVPPPEPAARGVVEIVALVASAGGLQAISALLAALPPDFPVPILIVQHLSPHQPSQMADILSRRITLPVAQAVEGDAPQPGHVYLAAPGRHLVVTPGRTLSLTVTEKVHHSRPSADVLLCSVAACFGAGAVAVVLTGGDGDGADGLRAVKDAGGQTIAQNEASSASFSMPRNAIATGGVDHILTLDAIAPMLVSLVTSGYAAPLTSVA